MVVTNSGKSGIGLLLGSVNTRPAYLGIGSGSGATVATFSGLVAHTDRNAFSSTDLSVFTKVGWTTFFSSVELSGLTMREFGTFAGSSGGTVWSRQGIQPVLYDGSEEVEIEVVWEVL